MHFPSNLQPSADQHMCIRSLLRQKEAKEQFLGIKKTKEGKKKVYCCKVFILNVAWL